MNIKKHRVDIEVYMDKSALTFFRPASTTLLPALEQQFLHRSMNLLFALPQSFCRIIIGAGYITLRGIGTWTF